MVLCSDAAMRSDFSAGLCCSVSKSMSKPQEEQHVDLDCADCYCHDSNKYELICLNTSSEGTLGKVSRADTELWEIRTRHREAMWPEIKTDGDAIIGIQMIM